MRFLLICLAAVALAVALAAPASAGVRSCGDIAKNGSGIFNVTSRGVTCKHARSFAKRTLRACDTRTTCTRGSFTCRTRQTGDEVWDTRCTSGARVVRFQFGA